MKTKLGADGEAAFAYVIAHEVGHHIQNLLGILPKVHQLQGQTSRTQANQLSVKVELQADCFAGVWAYQASKTGLFETGDIEKAFNAAEAVGDDRLQKRSQGYVVPDSFTHGTSAQRLHWFKRGLNSGDPNQCNTF
jgi:predicted metalloprotease